MSLAPGSSNLTAVHCIHHVAVQERGLDIEFSNQGAKMNPHCQNYMYVVGLPNRSVGKGDGLVRRTGDGVDKLDSESKR